MSAEKSPAEDTEEASPSSPPPSEPSPSKRDSVTRVSSEEPAAAEKPAKPPQKKDDDEEPLLDARADAEQSRLAPWWDAGGIALSIAYWATILVCVASLFRTRLLPFVDYPQHLALAGILRRMISGGGAERALFETNLLSYNSSFHVLVALFNLVIPIDEAGKLVIGIYAFVLGVATLALMRATGRPRARAFLVMPVLMGYSMIWGFANFSLGVAVQLLVLARILERTYVTRATEEARLARTPAWWKKISGGDSIERRRIYADAFTALLALFGAWTHLLATALVYMLMLVAIVVRVQTSREPLFARLGRALRTGLPLLPAIAYSYWVYKRQSTGAYQNYEYGLWEGNDDFALVKVKQFLDRSTGFRADELDGKVLSVGLGLLVISGLLRDEEDEAPVATRWLFVAAVVAYLALPHVFWATNYVYERITFLVVIGAIMWAPRAKPRFEAGLRLMFVSVGFAAAAAFFTAMGAAKADLSDLDRILDEAPKGRRVTGLIWDPRVRSKDGEPLLMQPALLHTPAYYVARDGGEVAFSFTRTMSLPVHYRPPRGSDPGTIPPDPPPNFEWNPQFYSTMSPWARYFDLVLVKTTWDDGYDWRLSIFGSHASEVTILAHHGKWWLYETNGVKPASAWDPGEGFHDFEHDWHDVDPSIPERPSPYSEPSLDPNDPSFNPSLDPGADPSTDDDDDPSDRAPPAPSGSHS